MLSIHFFENMVVNLNKLKMIIVNLPEVGDGLLWNCSFLLEKILKSSCIAPSILQLHSIVSGVVFKTGLQLDYLFCLEWCLIYSILFELHIIKSYSWIMPSGGGKAKWRKRHVTVHRIHNLLFGHDIITPLAKVTKETINPSLTWLDIPCFFATGCLHNNYRTIIYCLKYQMEILRNSIKQM